MSNSILVEAVDAALIIRFIRPAIRNPLSVAVLEELGGIIEDASGIPDIAVIVFTGTGDAFASGADLREIANVTPDTAREFSRRGQRLMEKIEALPKVTVAAINGFCFGGALDLALACDRRIASPSATFAHPGASLGIITGWGGTQLLPRLIGEANALEMFFTAAPINAERAFFIGLIEAIEDNAVLAACEFSSLPRPI